MTDLHSQVQYEADGDTDQFQVPFPYLDKSDVHVTQNGVNAYYEWINDQTVKLVPTPAGGALV